MKKLQMLMAALAVVAVAAATSNLQASLIIASDNASSSAYDDGWQSGDNDGFGFGPWSFSTPAGTSAFVLNSNTNGVGTLPGINTTIGADANGPTAPRSWGLSADGALIDPNRSLPAMEVGQTFYLSMDNGFINSAGTPAPGVGEVGFNLRTAALTDRFQFFINGNDSTYFILDGGGFQNTGVVQTEGGLNLAFKLTGVNTYSFDITPAAGGPTTTINGILNNSGVIGDVRVYANNTFRGFAGDEFRDFAFFNSMSLSIPEPSTVMLVAVGGLVMWRARRKA